MQNQTKEIIKNILRGGAEAARRAHNPKVVGSNPTPATKIRVWGLIFSDEPKSKGQREQNRLSTQSV